MSDPTIWGSGAVEVPGPPGPPGDPGPANTLSIGAVTTGPAAATITGASPAQTLNLVLPQGPQGPQGLPGPSGGSAPLGIGSVTSGTPAAASITGVAPNQVLNLVLPKGDQGDQGIPGPVSTTYGASFGFQDGYTTGLDLTNGMDMVWTEVRMDPNTLFTGFSGTNIVVPAAWNDMWFQFRCNLTTQESAGTEASTVSPTTAQKLVISHTRSGNVRRWRSSGAGGFTVGAKEGTSAPVQLKTGDTIKVTVYSTSTSSPGLGVESYLVLLPVGLGLPA